MVDPQQLQDSLGLGNLHPDPRVRDILFGIVCGFCCGLVLKRFGKVSAVATVGGCSMIHLLERHGYLTLRRDRLPSVLEQAAKRLQPNEKLLSRVQRYANQHAYFVAGLSGGFAAGFFLA